MKLLAFDIGASSGRAIEAELDGDSLSLKDVHRFKNGMLDRDGHKHWDIHRLHAELAAGLGRANRAVESVGIDTWGVDYGYVSPNGDLIGLPFAYRDARTMPMIDELHARIGQDRLYRLNGLQVMPFNSIYQFADDVRARPDVLERADRMLMMPELLGFLLTGEYAAEYSIASTSGMVDARSRDWSDELIAAVGMPRRLFTAISPPGGFSAPLRRELAQSTGLRAKLILPACHDTASAVAATPLDSPDAMYISSGTWSLCGMELPEPVLTKPAQRYNFTNEGGVDRTIRFLRNVMGLWLVQELQRLWAERGNSLGFGDICEQAKQTPPFAALVNPNLHRFYAPADMEAELKAECTRTGQRAPEGVGSLARCVFESLALAYRECLEQLRELTGRPVGLIHVVGGGVQNRLLCQMTADACGVPVLAGPVEATAIGNIVVQAIALGAIPDLAHGRRMIRRAFPLETYEPRDQAAWHTAWERYHNLPA